MGTKLIETRSAPVLLGATHRAFTFYLGNPLFSILSIRFILSKNLNHGWRGFYADVIQ